ncbi:MAG TPA: c-type cytochrome [Anaerolineales bacterium]|nr:c-type cytochrome [Anaerolineales bacterium]
MTDSLLGVAVLVVLALAGGWLSMRAVRGSRPWIRWIGGALSILLTVLLAALALFGAIGTVRLFRTHQVAVPDVKAGGGPEVIARGEHIAQVLCASCHSEDGDLPMSGGGNLSAETGMPLGDIYGPNLTPGGDIRDWTDADLFRVIRTGVDDEGRGTAMAAVLGPQALSDDDTLAVIAYLRQSPALEYETPPFRPTVLMALLAGFGFVPTSAPDAVSEVLAPSPGVTLEYGAYVAAFMDCGGCHGEKFDGNVAPPAPAGPNLKAAFAGWTEDEFISEVREHAAAPEEGEIMPWKALSQLDELEIRALYAYMRDQLIKPAE